ncbi:MAG: cell division protein ZapE [Polaromonas sp.]
MTPSARLEGAVARHIAALAGQHGFDLDAAQQDALRHFQRIADAFAVATASRGWLGFLRPTGAVRGLYLWGGVGRGKSFLMDSAFNLMPVERKRRAHFHRFMQEVHRDLQRLQGQAEPLDQVAARIAAEATLLCLDEFQVTDIGDAMLMRRLLEGLLARGVTIITTSNTAPASLYLHGLQRSQFVPAIELIERELDIVHLDAGVDYRLRALEKAGTWHQPDDATAEAAMAQAFRQVAGAEGVAGALEIEGREIVARRIDGGAAWFDFAALCDGPRGQADYIELSRRFHTVLLSGVPRFAAGQADVMRRFTWLVDEFYDRRVKLIVAAAGPALDLFAAVTVTSEQERTASRLVEMQTVSYLGAEHQS